MRLKNIPTEKLKEFADSDCKKCFGRGYKEYNVTQDALMICKCVLKNPEYQGIKLQAESEQISKRFQGGIEHVSV